ncbi:ABC-type dipeptide/oligopeptide/nickel transport system, ATPase component [Gemmobacter megaterium]|uniref:ABC-type dipeptide/oligopeptide/nickel transport system, ATPase component n=1 Tax=Gemmobacter megaterium TaxID=1086013 RepID=A0A1N7KIC5_9RHOB|nr:ABC transporter ATP-binding protein [Gemmobacter megaterium]GGE02297.1 ABC transporter ATP-binding protein [Gemmobacter megaterium]SIS61299.1 ABC-type dipeptide/oligopeptide/nickel transport system, ATPase component [Gemmobacter megaterium]
MTLLSVENLRVTFPSDQGPVEVVKGLSFSLGRERLGIVGESGSGKSMTGRAVMGLIGKPARVTADRMEFEGQDLRNLPESRLRALRGARMSMVLQDPKFSLNPVIRIGDQIAEALEFHTALNARARRAKVLEALEAVRIDDPERVARQYPHEVSGGMGQRVMIAMMVVMEPALMIADEPTSALDVSVRGQVLDIMDDLVRRRGMGLMLISHDLNMVARWCDRILVMYQGRIVEELGAGQLSAASHPYTRGLLASVPRIDEDRPRLPVLDRAALEAAR